ncbi:hypothetical protein [Uliginosibacterium sp. 31-12]|uniref:hypothetical protein n=1 Tax=Uliginosibacterium sp. 31-12 TaxID=3062781 RepID=UPI0026E3C2A0|nr:hypothetical protein [Uliginosibacterium sp. 31-12]MDO6387000.1 hypothetical protein [Uliginosibacterium sp. 31-12]
MKPVLHALLGLAALLLSGSISARPEAPMLLMSTPGEALVVDIPENPPLPPMQLKDAWYAVSLEGQTLILSRTDKTRVPDWQLVARKTGPTPQTTTPVRHALTLPAPALLAFRLMSTGGNEKLPALKPGSYPSALSAPALLHDRWVASVQANGKPWSLSTPSQRRKDGALLAGSLQLVATDAKGEQHILVPPAHGMAFERQELLWVGALRSDSELDLLLKRTWLTGEVEYVLKLGDSLGYARLDTDYPIQRFAQGIEEYEGTETHASQQRRLPEGKFGLAALKLSEEAWNQAIASAESEGLPRQLFDRQLMLNGEKIRFSFEYLPRLAANGSEPSSSQFMWEGAVLVRAHFRGKSQTLQQTGPLDGSALRLQVDMLNGEPAIEISWAPHYNNSFVSYWVWSERDKRFLRLSRAQSQGC